MDRKGGNKERMRNVESESLSIFSFSLHFLLISSYTLHFLTSWMLGYSGLRNPGYDIVEWISFKLWDYKILRREKGGQRK